MSHILLMVGLCLAVIVVFVPPPSGLHRPTMIAYIILLIVSAGVIAFATYVLLGEVKP